MHVRCPRLIGALLKLDPPQRVGDVQTINRRISTERIDSVMSDSGVSSPFLRFVVSLLAVPKAPLLL